MYGEQSLWKIFRLLLLSSNKTDKRNKVQCSLVYHSVYIVKDQLSCSLFRFVVLLEDSADLSNVSSHVHPNSQLAQPELPTIPIESLYY